MKRFIFIIVVFLFIFNFSIITEAQQIQKDKERTKTNQLVYNADSFRDPFLPQIKKERVKRKKEKRVSKNADDAQKFQFHVQGMVWNTDMPQAIIDNKVFKIGDKIDEAEIIGIDRDGVKFLYRGRTFTIRPEFPNKKERR